MELCHTPMLESYGVCCFGIRVRLIGCSCNVLQFQRDMVSTSEVRVFVITACFSKQPVGVSCNHLAPASSPQLLSLSLSGLELSQLLTSNQDLLDRVPATLQTYRIFQVKHEIRYRHEPAANIQSSQYLSLLHHQFKRMAEA